MSDEKKEPVMLTPLGHLVQTGCRMAQELAKLNPDETLVDQWWAHFHEVSEEIRKKEEKSFKTEKP